MTEHKWAEEIKAWALDRDCIEQRYASPEQNANQAWHAFDQQWDKQLGWRYRIKPVVLPKVENAFTIIVAGIYFNTRYPEITLAAKNVKLTVDKDYVLRNVRMIGKPDPERMEALLWKVAQEWGDSDAAHQIREALRTD